MRSPTFNLDSFTPDAQNANRGTRRGKSAINASLKKLGAGRSILVDKNGNVIAGNKTLEGAKAAGMTDVIVVESDGSKLVVVQRTDLDLTEDPKARELAYADNRAGELDLNWDAEQIAKDMSAGIDLGALWSEEELAELTAVPTTEDDQVPHEYSSIIQYKIIFDSIEQQSHFHAFIRMLKEKFPDLETIGARLDAYIQFTL